ncbi:MAG: hypothetical protein U0V74_15780 [Chitinophagales bacterium]
MKQAFSFLLLFCALVTNAQGINYLSLGSGESHVYKHKEETFVYYYPATQKLIAVNSYYLVITMRADNVRDTAYYRETNEGVVSINPESGKETLEIPATDSIGKSWFAADSSWKYEVLSTNASLITPAGNYTELLQMQVKQVERTDTSKATEYLLFFSKDKGFVGSMAQGQLVNYLSEIQQGKYVFTIKKDTSRNTIPALIVLFVTILTFIGVGWFVKRKMFDTKSDGTKA